MNIDESIRIIRKRIGFCQTVEEVHDALVVPFGLMEEEFHLAWHAALVMERDDADLL